MSTDHQKESCISPISLACKQLSWVQDGKTEYKSVTVSDNATAQEFMDFYLDDPSRHIWVCSATPLKLCKGTPKRPTHKLLCSCLHVLTQHELHMQQHQTTVRHLRCLDAKVSCCCAVCMQGQESMQQAFISLLSTVCQTSPLSGGSPAQTNMQNDLARLLLCERTAFDQHFVCVYTMQTQLLNMMLACRAIQDACEG